MRKGLSVVAALAIGLGSAALVASPASASGGCSGSQITINSGSGAEPPSTAYGHGHTTGNHYIKGVTYVGLSRYVEWWADNNGGWDGDTKDTYYTTTFCA